MSSNENSGSTEPPAPVVADRPQEQPSKRGFPVVPIVVAIGVGAIVFGGQALSRHASARTNRVALGSSAKHVTVVEARPAEYRSSRRYVGTLSPWIEAHVGPQIVSAYVSTVLVRPGASVHHGDVLATLDCREPSAASQAVALQARALAARQSALASQATRIGNLLNGGFVSQNEVEQQQAESASEQARLLATRAQLLGTSLAVRDCVLRAPFNGEVADRRIDPGAFVRPGSALVALVDRSVVRITADVPETDFDVVAPTTPVRLRILATGRDLTGTIARRSPSADPATRTIHLEIDVPNPDRSLPVNTTAEIGVDVGTPAPAAEIPLSAANIRGQRANIFVVEGDVAHARTFPVLGERGGSLFLATELAPGSHVVTEGRSLLADGDRVDARVAPSTPEPTR